MKKKLKIFFICVLVLCVVVTVVVVGINIYVINTTKDQIVDQEKAKELKADCILILGAGVWENDQPSHMLSDRLDEGIALYKAGVAPKILMSGDHGRVDYDEVNVMKDYAIERGVPAEDIFMDHAGFSTYESMYRADYIFEVKKMVVVTQKYHMYRALHICDKLGIEACGVNSDPRTYVGQTARDIREVGARVKDVFTCMYKPEPTYLGDVIPITGDGNATNDK
jgi:vancomycin permeability regulator SanA